MTKQAHDKIANGLIEILRETNGVDAREPISDADIAGPFGRYRAGLADGREASARILAAWIENNGFCAGHASTTKELLLELKWQVDELRATKPVIAQE